MTDEDIRNVVVTTALEVFELETDELTDRASFRELHIDSLTKLEFIGALEERFDIRYTSSQGSEIDSVEDAVRFTQTQL